MVQHTGCFAKPCVAKSFWDCASPFDRACQDGLISPQADFTRPLISKLIHVNIQIRFFSRLEILGIIEATDLENWEN